ncbi:MAG: ABC transporter substrate-binding protein, partial [Bacteroidetes bacterium]|nr:ABC transporter substrate-binding protein [Bacteroidota bacterium]
MTIKIFTRVAAGLLGGAFLLVSCGDQAKQARRIFHYNEVTGIATLDPAFAKNQSIMWAVHQIYSTLIETDDQLHMVPSLAKSWEVSPDRRIYTFHLRDDVYFHDNDAFPGGKGRRLTAYDVEYSFKRIVDKNTASSRAWIFNTRVDSTDGFHALNDTLFRLTLVRP